MPTPNKLVIDANILISFLLTQNASANLLFKHNIHLFMPEFALQEVKQNKNWIIERTGFSATAFESAFELIQKRIRMVPKERYVTKAKLSLQICPHEKDAEYFALALYLGIPLWSNDKKLKRQKFVKVYSTRELLEMLD